jgi:DNA mismatch endonuclease, patch repair protein
MNMADVHNRITRRYNMSRIKCADTKPEMIVRRFLHANGFRFRLHNNKLQGKPDLTLSRYQTVIFVNGCFWHGHENCKFFAIPKTRTEWWLGKIIRNKANDFENTAELKKMGWEVITIWECELKPTKREEGLNSLITKIKSV